MERQGRQHRTENGDVRGSPGVPTDREHEKLRAPLDGISGARNGVSWRAAAPPHLLKRLGLRGRQRPAERPSGRRFTAIRTRNNRLFSIPYYTYEYERRTLSRPLVHLAALPDYLLPAQTRQLALHEQALQILVLDHLREIEARRLHLSRGYGSLFDYVVTKSIYKYCNGLLVAPISRYYFRNPLVVSDHS